MPTAALPDPAFHLADDIGNLDGVHATPRARKLGAHSGETDVTVLSIPIGAKALLRSGALPRLMGSVTESSKPSK